MSKKNEKGGAAAADAWNLKNEKYTKNFAERAKASEESIKTNGKLFHVEGGYFLNGLFYKSGYTDKALDKEELIDDADAIEKVAGGGWSIDPKDEKQWKEYWSKEGEKNKNKGTSKKGPAGYSYPSTNSYTQPALTPLCTHADSGIFEIDGITYAAGSTRGNTDIMVFDEPTLRISFKGAGYSQPAKSRLVKAPDTLYDRVQDYFKENQAIDMQIDWVDRGAPPFRFGFVERVHDWVKEQGIKRITGFCIGGHGRTGTWLASVLIECTTTFTAKDAIAYVRKHHCKEAIESKEQEAWLKKDEEWAIARDEAIEAAKAAAVAAEGEVKDEQG